MKVLPAKKKRSAEISESIQHSFFGSLRLFSSKCNAMSLSPTGTKRPLVQKVHVGRTRSFDQSDDLIMADVSDFLKSARLEKYAQAFRDLGVESVQDLEYVVSGDLLKMGRGRSSQKRTFVVTTGNLL